MIEEKLPQIKDILQDFFSKIGEEPEINLEVAEGSTLKINLYFDEPRHLIGQSGQVLLAIQHILRAVLRRKTEEVLYVDLDINDYKKNKLFYLKELAREAADEVALTKKTKELIPMSAYERRIVHLELQDRRDVVTESVGEDLDRRVEIKPA